MTYSQPLIGKIGSFWAHFANTNYCEQVYQLSHPIRGRVLIINISQAEKPRKGSEADYSNLKSLFRDLKFDIVKVPDSSTYWTVEVC